MAFYTWTIQDLQTLSATSLQLTYNTDGADTLSLTLRPENYAELPLQALDRLTVTDGERIVFSGLVPMGANCAAEAAAGETVEIELQSDYYVLDHTVYAKLNSKGEAVFSRVPSKRRTMTLAELCATLNSWLASHLPSRLTCPAQAVIPTPSSNGTAPCSSLLTDGMRWAPDAVLVQRYAAEGNRLLVTTPGNLEAENETKTVIEQPSGTTEDNWNGYGFGCIVQQSGTVKRLEIECRHEGSAQPANIPVWVKVWLAVSDNSQLLAVSDNSQLHSVNAVLSYEFPEFEVTAGDELRVSFHTADGLETTAYQMGVQCCMRVVAKDSNEPGGMLGSMGSYGDTSQRRWMAKYAWHIEVKMPLTPLALSPATHPLQSVTLRAREDLRVPVCALVGRVHATWPAGADIRTLGAFVYAVPVEPKQPDEEEPPGNGAGGSPASQKMIIKGVAIPERRITTSDALEYNTTPIIADSNTAKFIRAFFPEYAPFIDYMEAGACLVEAVSKEDLEASMDDDGDEDAKAPANYEPDINSWAVGDTGVYVLTQGSFTASSRNSKNLKGLRWCKAVLSLVLCVKARPSDVPSELWATAEELFPGRRKKDKIKYAYVRKTLTCNLINRRRRVYDPARNAPCSGDPEYTPPPPETPEDDPENPTNSDYKTAMGQYYRAASKLQHEGNVSMLYDGSINPAELTGRWLTVHGMRPEWETMQAVVRSVQWDYMQRKLSMSVGPRSVMGFSEYLERRVIGRNRGRDKAQEEALAYDSQDEEVQQETEAEMSVSPSISAGTDSTSTGRWVKPFTLFTNPETKKLTMKGGVLKKGGQQFVVEDSETQIKDGAPGGAEWAEGVELELRWKKKNNLITFDIYQKEQKNEGGGQK